jgi:hypothetical protein
MGNAHATENYLRDPKVLGVLARRLGSKFASFCVWAEIDQTPEDGFVPLATCRLIDRSIAEWKYIACGPDATPSLCYNDRNAIDGIGTIEEEEDFCEVGRFKYLSILTGFEPMPLDDGRMWSDEEGNCWTATDVYDEHASAFADEDGAGFVRQLVLAIRDSDPLFAESMEDDGRDDHMPGTFSVTDSEGFSDGGGSEGSSDGAGGAGTIMIDWEGPDHPLIFDGAMRMAQFRPPFGMLPGLGLLAELRPPEQPAVARGFGHLLGDGSQGTDGE